MIDNPLTRGFVFAGALALAATGGAFFAKNKSNNFVAVLTPGQTLPFAETSKAFGVSYSYLTDDKMFCYSLSYVEPNSDELFSHIHGPGPPGGGNAVVQFELTDNPGSPRKDCLGPLTNAQIKDLRAGLWYFVIHTEEWERGELRGQIVSAFE